MDEEVGSGPDRVLAVRQDQVGEASPARKRGETLDFLEGRPPFLTAQGDRSVTGKERASGNDEPTGQNDAKSDFHTSLSNIGTSVFFLTAVYQSYTYN